MKLQDNYYNDHVDQRLIHDRLQQLHNNPDVFWCCGNESVYTKYQAMKRLAAGQATHFNCFDSQWRQKDWALEPNQSVNELMIENAKQIRRKYNWVRVSYSGGADSQAVLTAFRDANLAPDEIFFWTKCHEYKSFYNSNYEIDLGVIPYVSVLRQWFPRTKITHVNFSFERLKALKLLHPDNLGFELTAGLRSLPVAACVASFEQFKLDDDTVTITGSDKPRLDYINGHWYAWLTDQNSSQTWGKNIYGFFQNSDATIYIKQCHLLKKWLCAKLPVIDRRSVLSAQASTADKWFRHTINDVLGRPRPFDPIMASRKTSKRLPVGLGESNTKAVILYRTLRDIPQGLEFIQAWEHTKQQFKTDTGFCPTVNVFGKFYNLDTGEINSVDELFPRGWHGSNHD